MGKDRINRTGERRQRLVLEQDNPFTPRQRDILKLILEGVTDTKTISRRLGISANTAKNEIQGEPHEDWEDQDQIPNHSLGLFGVAGKYFNEGTRPQNRTELLVLLLQKGVVEVEEI